MRCLLVLWDIDFTLVDAGGVGTRLYRMVFRDMFGTDLPGAADMAGRTDRAIVLDTLARAGIPEPRQHLDQFLARLAALAPAGRDLTERHSRALPGAAAALDALSAFAPSRDGASTDGASLDGASPDGAAPETLRIGQLKSTLGEKLPGRGSSRAAEPFCIKIGRRLVRGKQPPPPALLVAGDVTALLVGQLDAGAGREPLDRLGKGEVVHLLHEPDDVTAVRAGEAVPQAPRGGHVERRGLLVVERAQAFQRAAPGVAELEVLTDNLGDGRLLADQRDVLVADPACHSHPSLQRSPSRRV